LHESQHAYQKGKSAETALPDLVSRVEGALEQKIFAMGCFLDIENAFDNTSFQAMNRSCGRLGVNPTSTRWIDAFLGQRTVTAVIRGENITMKVRKGCPQGDVLSPLLWNMVIDELIRRLNHAGLWSRGFADNILNLTNQVKYLGVILDSKLTWDQHIDSRFREATVAMWQCRRAIGKTWELKPKVVYCGSIHQSYGPF
jgi:Reverse transcriptase (RNA-dependent DNA polymerase)